MSKATKDLIKLVETKASERNSSSEAQKLLEQAADITATTSSGATMIHSIIAEEKRYRSVMQGKADVCQSLVDVLQKAASERLAAQVFMTNGSDIKEMHRLVQLKGSCYQSATYGSLGLLGALLKQDGIPIRLDVVQFLLQADPDVKYSLTMTDDEQNTLLSVVKHNSKCPQDVIDYMQRYFDQMLNQIAFVEPNIDPDEIMLWIHRGANIEAIDEHSNTALLNAVIANNIGLTRTLLSAGSNITHRNNYNLTVFEIAKSASVKNPSLITILGTHQVNVELKHLIETKGAQLTTDELYILLEKGANINAKVGNNNTFLHLLVLNKGTPEMITAFVSTFNADISAANITGYRPIELCILQDEDPFLHLQTFLKLPKMTTDLFINPKLNKTILQFAFEQNRSQVAKIIQAELNHRLWNCVTRINIQKDISEKIMTELKQLVTYGAEIDHQYCHEGSEQRTLLQYACEVGARRLVQYMIEHLYANYTLQFHNGNYPISIVAESGYLSIVEYLRGLPNLNLNVPNSDGQTALHLATNKRHMLVVQYLVKWGADYQTKNRLQQTPLDIARVNVSQNKEDEFGDQKLIRFLEQLICPPVDQSIEQSSHGKAPDLDLDTCELVTPVLVNPIPTTTERTGGAIGKSGKSLFSKNPSNNLHDAAKNGSVWEAQRAIGEGADICYRKGNRTPYEIALASEKEYDLQLKAAVLISSNCKVLEQMVAGCQQIANMIQHIANRKLIEAIDQSDASLVKAYHLASGTLSVDLLYRACNASDNVEIVDYLLNENVDIHQALISDSSSDSPYQTVKRKRFMKLTAYLKYRLSLECTEAVKQNDLELVRKLISVGASVDTHDTNNLNEALQHQNVELIQILCENGARMPLNWITSKSIILEPIVSQELKPEVVFCINQCLINRRLRFSAASGDLDGVIQCQRLGADIDSMNCHGSTALLCTIQHGNYFRIVHTLVSSGASILHLNENESMSLLDLANSKNYKQIAGYLSEQLNIQFLAAIVNNQRQTAEKLANMGVDFNYQDEQKRTALHYAVQYYSTELVNWLCECGSSPTICDINGDYPLIQAIEKGDYTSAEYFIMKYPATKRQTNKAGQTALQMAENLNFARIVELIKMNENETEPELIKNQGKAGETKHDYETLLQASRDGHIKIIQDFIDQSYDSKADKRHICDKLIQQAEKAKQFQILDILESHYNKLSIDMRSDVELNRCGGIDIILSQHHQKVLLGFLSGLSDLIANSPIILDPADPKTYVELFSGLTENMVKRSQELQQVTNEQDVVKIVQQDETNTKEQLIKINGQLESLEESRNSLQSRIQEADERLFKQRDLTAIQRKESFKAIEALKQQMTIYECSIFLFQRQQEATIARQKTINFIKGNSNLMMFYRTIESLLEAVFHGVLARQGGYLKEEASVKFGRPFLASDIASMSVPILQLTSESIKMILSPMLSRIHKKEQKKEWENFSTLGNIEELRRIASDTAGLLTLYYREQIQCIDPSQKIKNATASENKASSTKYVYGESSGELSVVTVAEYITTWIVEELKLGRDRLVSTEPLPHQLWLCVAKRDPVSPEMSRKLTSGIGSNPIGHKKICLKIKDFFDKEIIVPVRIRYLIGCVSVVGNDGGIYQYPVSADSSDNELKYSNLFGYVYVTPFSSDEKTLQTIVEGRKLCLASRDEHGNILTKFEDIIEHAKAYAIQNKSLDPSKSLITLETAKQVTEVIRAHNIFANLDDVKEELRKTREAIELSVDAFCEEINDKVKVCQTSIDAAHEQIREESEKNRVRMTQDNEMRYERAQERLDNTVKDMEKRLEQLVDTRMRRMEKRTQERAEKILETVEIAKAQCLQAVENSQQLLEQAKQATISVRSLLQQSEQQNEKFQSEIALHKSEMKQIAAVQRDLCEQMMSEMRTIIERDIKQARLTRQSTLEMRDIQQLIRHQLELHAKEMQNTKANAQQQIENEIKDPNLKQ
ncbi:unnamed protein product [Adineta ricciae]|uniref:Ankyrin repeat protein n=1 Tax=Adineta ricciae TaxID=249248 RepID=A0A814MFZ0_ADIRI|nr:unnamed protein product [Adineta ricciae]CAF1077497.1 unnamed protein product [Adineta ricciae]